VDTSKKDFKMAKSWTSYGEMGIVVLITLYLVYRIPQVRDFIGIRG